LIESDIQDNPAILTAGGPAGFRITPGCAGLSGMTPFTYCDPVWAGGDDSLLRRTFYGLIKLSVSNSHFPGLGDDGILPYIGRTGIRKRIFGCAAPIAQF
jgi:hypothetical protein